MARRNSLPAANARIFSRKPSRTSRILSGLLLSLSLLVTLAGLGTAVYLERARDSATPVAAESPSADTPAVASPIVPAAVVAKNETHDPMAASAAIPAPPPAPPSIEPLAGPAAATAAPAQSVGSVERPGAASAPAVAPPAPQVARLEVTPEPPARAVTQSPAAPTTLTETREPTNTTSTAQYWVEYGVYTNARAAKRLQQALADQGLDTVIARTHTPDGRPLLRVRSTSELDYGAAKMASDNAGRRLKLSALVHRGTPAAGEAVAQGPAAKASASQGYWVQFGAFTHRPQAARLQEQLAKNGIETAVSTMRGTSGRTLYWVRSLNLPDRDSAMAIATRGQAAGNADFLVGQSIARSGAAGAGDHDRTEDDSTTRTARYRTAESMPFPAR